MNDLFLLLEAIGVAHLLAGFQMTKYPQEDSSIKMARGWLEKAEAAYGEDDRRVVPFLYELGARFIANANNHTAASECYERACYVASRAGDPESLEMAEALFKTGECALQSGDMETAEARIPKALAIRRSKLGDDHPLTGQCWAATVFMHLLKSSPGTAPAMLRAVLGHSPPAPSSLPPEVKEAAEKTLACLCNSRREVLGEDTPPMNGFDYNAAMTSFRVFEQMRGGFDESLKALKGAPAGTPQGGAGKDGCFIATAVYGSRDCREVASLRRFRDERLLPNAAGRAIVGLYGVLGPVAARLVKGRPGVRSALRKVLDPVAAFAGKSAGK